ncbi:MAG: amino acid permease [Spirochaetia bacterium]|nr:amino acid permease [Spirochaetia bacterium]
MHQTTLKRDLGLTTAVLVVIASMIGSGIFGNTGIIQQAVGNPLIVLLLWLLGGLIALSGALCYAELASMMPHAGGEYVYLKHSFGLMPSFLTGWVSFIVGFSAPAAASALLVANYLYETLHIAYPDSAVAGLLDTSLEQKIAASLMIVFFGLFHMSGSKKGGTVQNLLTIAKIGVILFFGILGFYVVLTAEPGSRAIPEGGFNLLSGYDTQWDGFGVGLLWVMFAYSGWNGATYLAEEIKNPERNLPKALFRGTLFTIIIYLLLNVLFYLTIPVDQLSGSEAVFALSADHIFGTKASLFFNLSFVVMLLSSVSVNIMIGPRVYYAMAKDHLFFKSAGNVHGKYGTPFASIAIQCLLSIVYIASGSYEGIMTYMMFALSFFPILSVLGLFILRKKIPDEKRPYKTKLFPFFPLFFAGFSLFIMITSFVGRPMISSIAIAVVLSGIPVYYLWTRLSSWAARPKE